MSKQTLRIAFVDYVLEPEKPGRSGLSDIVWDMASELVNQGHEAHIIATYKTQEYPDHRVVVHNFPTPPIGYRNIIGQFWILQRAAKIVKQFNPDIVHAPEYVSTAVLATLGIQQPLVCTVPGNVFRRIKYGHSYEWSFLQVLKWAARVSARCCAAIIAVSTEMKRWWEWTGSDPQQTLYIPYGVDPHRFFHVPDARSRLGLDPDQLHLLFVGRFAREKGLFDLMHAVRNLKDLCMTTNVRITLAGSGLEKPAIRKFVDQERLGQRVILEDWIPQDNLRLWYSAADALLLPSWNEPFGKVMIEAMSCGTPVIASATEGPVDHVIHGKTGFLFPPRDPQALQRVLQLTMTQPLLVNHMRQSALNYVTSGLTWKHIVSRVVREVYEPIVRTSRCNEHNR